jgi:NitT/TauT family transport system ATP-binding protein
MADGATPIVEIKGVSKQFELQGERIEALRDAHLSVSKGEFVCLIGASGCGKSTLLRILAGFEPPTRGEALMWGMPIAGPAPARGMVFQDYGLFPWLNVRRNIGFGPASRGRPAAEVRETVERFIALVGLQRFAEAFPHQLSGGMKQRVAIARVLANDAETRERLQDELLEIWRRTGLTVVFVTHSIEEAIFLADRVVVMSPGPGRIDSEMRIELPRPRDVSAPEFNDIRRELGRKLHSNLARKAA